MVLKEMKNMNITPTLDEIKGYKDSGQYDVCPVSTEILSDFITPIEAIRILKNVSTHTYMLESAFADEKWGRYTFLGYEPKLSISFFEGEANVNGETISTPNPSEYLRNLMSGYRSPKISKLPTFTGGLVGYFSYDYLLFDKVIAFDNVKQKIVLIANIKLDDCEANYENAKNELNSMAKLLRNGEKYKEPKSRLLSEVKPLFNKEQYCEMVEKGKHYIKEGDIFQIVLSNRLSADYEGSLFDTYRVLRTINPSPYMFYFSGTDVEVAGASPETLVKLEDGVLHTFPLAGSRPRGKNEEEDKALITELLADEKELAEHNMLVDLGRNDLGRISEFGSVVVEDLRSVVKYSHIMHIASTVRGNIRNDKDAFDAIEAVLPAGTLSGAPKIRACQLIGELEGNKRGIYGGAIGYIDFTGNMDTCIGIRTAYKKNGKVFVRSGAGIVADSVPETEYQESINKAQAVINALKLSEEVVE